MKKRFLGSRDPNALVLEDLFPLTNIKISTELILGEITWPKNRFQEFVLEGEEEYLRFIEDNSDQLIRGGWRLGDPLQKGDNQLRLFKKLEYDFKERIEVPVLRGWHDLSEHFILANRVRLVMRKESEDVLVMICDIVTDSENRDLLRVRTSNSALPFEGLKDFN